MDSMDCPNYINRLSLALLQPVVRTRCAELNVLFDRCNVKDLQAFFPTLLEHIFGSQYSVSSWGLRSITSTLHYADFQTLQHFFNPMGPLFKLIYLLLRDPSLKYEFSLNGLQHIHLSEYYSEMCYQNPQQPNSRPSGLLLNPFDYYMFTFAQHLVDPRQSCKIVNVNNLKLNSLYYILCCDYVLHFLPTNNESLVLPRISYEGKAPASRPYTVIQRPSHHSNLFKPSAFSDNVNDFSAHQPNFHPKRDIWRSETVLHVFIDVWLHIPVNNTYELNGHLSQYSELPSTEQIRIIRVLVKQLHAFSSSGKHDNSHMGELKIVTRQLFQEKIYRFLRNLIHRWPLDGSFRLVLELWLSYIQPWRYPGTPSLLPHSPGHSDQQPDDDSHRCNEEYIPFIAENLLPYVVIFQQLLPRFLRVDLSSPKNSLMLYRLTKVFDQDYLVPFLKDVETCVENRNHSPTHYYMPPGNGMPPLSPTACWSSNTTTNPPAGGGGSSNNTTSFYDSTISAHSTRIEYSTTNGGQRRQGQPLGERYAGVVRQKVYELEGANFCYKPLFQGQPAPEVYELLKYIKQSEHAAIEILTARQADIDKQFSGFFGAIRAIFTSCDIANDECTLDDRKKVPIYLQCAFQHLTDMFQIKEIHYDVEPLPQPVLQTSLDNTTGNYSGLTDGSFMDVMTPEKVKQRSKLITYDGDPDLHPVRSNENTFLVRTLYQLALFINNTYGEKIKELYDQPNYLGKLSRRFISSPVTVFRFDKSLHHRTRRVASRLPARISFRKLASHHLLAFLIVSYIALKFFGYSNWFHLIVFATLWSLYHVISAVFDEQRAVTGGLNFSGNDSY